MNKKILIAVCVLLAVIIPVAAVGINAALNKPTDRDGGFSSDTIDRINYSVDKTDFTFKKGETGEYQFSFLFTVSKAEADFYGRIDSIKITGIDYTSVGFEAQGETPDAYTDGLVLSAQGGTPCTYSYLVTVTTAEISGNAEINFTFTSGLTKLTSETTEKIIPLNFTTAE